MAVFGEAQWREHAALVGSLTLAWNRNVHQLLRVFMHLTGVESPVADAIFFSSQSDSSQRRLIKQVAKAVGLADPHLQILNMLLKRLDVVSTKRNLAAHVIFGVTAFDRVTGAWDPKVVPVLDPPQDNRLHEDFAGQFRDAERTLDAIYHELEHWLVYTPFPPRAWGGPPLPIAAARQAEGFASEPPSSLASI